MSSSRSAYCTRSGWKRPKRVLYKRMTKFWRRSKPTQWVPSLMSLSRSMTPGMNQVSYLTSTRENASMDWINLFNMSRTRGASGTRIAKYFLNWRARCLVKASGASWRMLTLTDLVWYRIINQKNNFWERLLVVSRFCHQKLRKGLNSLQNHYLQCS